MAFRARIAASCAAICAYKSFPFSSFTGAGLATGGLLSVLTCGPLFIAFNLAASMACKSFPPLDGAGAGGTFTSVLDFGFGGGGGGSVPGLKPGAQGGGGGGKLLVCLGGGGGGGKSVVVEEGGGGGGGSFGIA